MGRVVNTNAPAKRRNHLMRTIAEILRGLGQKKGVDDEVKDMVATIILSLKEIDETIGESVKAWEKRNYYKKADDFQEKWWWSQAQRPALEKVLLEDKWEDLPIIMLKLLPHFADIEINKAMRSDRDWTGNYEILMPQITQQK
jgi:hypothetical protein